MEDNTKSFCDYLFILFLGNILRQYFLFSDSILFKLHRQHSSNVFTLKKLAL